MALTAADQLGIINGKPKPDSGSLLDLTHQISVNEITSKSGSKIVFTEVDGVYSLPVNVPAQLQAYWDALPDRAKNQTALSNAVSYQDKMIAFSQRVIRGGKQVKLELQQTVVSFMSSTVSVSDLKDDASWTHAILDEITKTFELLAETTAEEQAYFKALIPPVG